IGSSPIYLAELPHRFVFRTVRHDHISGEKSADATKGGQRPKGIFGGNDIDARAKTGIQSRLKKRSLPPNRPVLKKVQRLFDTVYFLNRGIGRCPDTHRHRELKPVHLRSLSNTGPL